jgi:hypothetical protein
VLQEGWDILRKMRGAVHSFCSAFFPGRKNQKRSSEKCGIFQQPKTFHAPRGIGRGVPHIGSRQQLFF